MQSIRSWKQSYKIYFTDKNYLLSFVSGSVLLAISLFVQYFASNYATKISSESVTDIVLSNTRVYDVGWIFVWGAVIVTIIILLVGLWRLNYMPFGLKSAALFILIRAFFVTLTHTSPFPTHVLISSNFFRDAAFNGIFNGNDLFFSGHTGFSFLFALMLWNINKNLRYVLLGFSIMFGVVVLLGHLHYTIDVVAAFFITYSIFNICKFLFKKDWELFTKKTSP